MISSRPPVAGDLRPASSVDSSHALRSADDGPRAATLYLETLRLRCSIEALVIVDELGQIVAAAGPAALIAELANAGHDAFVAADRSDALADRDVFVHKLRSRDAPGGGAERSLVLVSVDRRIDHVRIALADLEHILR